MTRRFAVVVAATAAFFHLSVAARAAHATTTRSFRQTTARDFEEGEASASMVLPTGEVIPGLKTARVPLEAAFVWCAALSPDGRTAYFGTGDQGRLYAVSTQRPAGAEPAARKVVELDAAWITSLAVRPDGTILAGTTPGGRVFAIDPQKGSSTVFAKLGTDHVWALVHDAKTGTTYAGTGGAGKIFALDAKGKSRLLWDSGDKHVVSLLHTGGGTLLAGTSEEAIVYRVRPDGKAEALHDFDADEVRAILRTGTGPGAATYLAVNDFERGNDLGGGAVGTAAAAAAPKGTKVQVALGGTPASAGALPRPGQVKSKAAVYRLDDDGNIEQVFASSDSYFTALIAGEAGDVYAASGTGGKLYRIAADRSATLAADLPERQALAVVRAGDGFLIGSGDVGGVYRARPAVASEATYLSKVFDAEWNARWGRLRWSGSQALLFETRSGHTTKPDKTWTDWRKLDGVLFDASEGEGQISSPPARYLQYRATLPGKGAILKEATLHFLPQNQRPRITDVTLADAGGATAVGLLSSVVTASPARVHSPVLKLRFKVDNADGDELIYKIWYREDGGRPGEKPGTWRSLGGPEPLTKPEYDWNTDSVPDGRYVFRVWVSDEKTTPRERALESTFESPPMLVDNGKPDVRELAARVPVVTGRAHDDASPISQIEFSVDGNEWRPVAPSDSLLDQRSEAFSLKLPATLVPGAHVVTVRALDAADNIGSSKITVETR